MNSVRLKHPIWGHFTRIEVLLFLALWLSYGMLINAKNVEDFGQSTVEAIVDQHRFGVEDLPVWPARGDVFGYNGHTFSNKQPGQAMVCSVAYSHLRLAGFSYASNKLLTGSLVIFLSGSLLTAFLGVVVYRFARDLDGQESTIWPVGAALVFGWGTTAFAYSGIAHHDTIATAFLVTAFYLFFLVAYDPRADRDRLRSVLGGLLLGLTLTTSMLHFFMVVVIGIYFLSQRKWKLIVPVLTGGVIGILPMLIYNTINFGNPFLLPAIANYRFTGYNPEVFFFFTWNNFLEKLYVYYVQINWYMPVFWFGLIGLFFIRSERRREVLAIAGAIAVLAFYMTNVEGLGTCAYGPRYLLPIVPFTSLGIIGLRRVPTIVLRVLAAVALLVIGIKSIGINLVGAMFGAMYCNMAAYAYPDYLARLSLGETPDFLLLPWLLPASLVFFVLLFLKPFVPAQPQSPLEPTEVSMANSKSPIRENFSLRHWASSIRPRRGIVLLVVALLLLALIAMWWIFSPSRVDLPGAPTAPTVATTESRDDKSGLSKARGIAVDANGNYYVADTGNSRIQKFASDGSLQLTFGRPGTAEGELGEPNGVEVHRSGNIYLTDAANSKLLKFDPSGTFLKEWRGPEPGFRDPRGLAPGPNDQMYIVDQGNRRIVKFDLSTEEFKTLATSGTDILNVTGLTVGAGRIFLMDLGSDSIKVLDLEGTSLGEWPVPDWQHYPWQLPDGAVGLDGKRLYVTNGMTGEILIFDMEGNQIDKLPQSPVVQLNNPSSIVISNTDKKGLLYVLNSGNLFGDQIGSSVTVIELTKDTRKSPKVRP